MSRAEDNSRSVSGMTLNDGRLSDEREHHSELSVAIMGKLIPRNSKTLPKRSESVLRYTAYFTEDFSVIAAPCTRIITNSSQSWTPKTG